MKQMRRQSGFTLSKMLMISVVVGLVALLGFKLTPEYIEYYKILHNVRAVGLEVANRNNATVADVRLAFSRRADIDHIKNFAAEDLEVSKDGNRIVIDFAYQRKVPLFKNISILIDFQGSSAD